MLVLDSGQVEALLDLRALIDALGPAMAELSAGRAQAPERVGVRVAGGGTLLAMPGYVPSARALVSKMVGLFPGNAGGPLPTHQAVIVAFSPSTGAPVALLDGTVLTAARTAACSALSARLLAREDASVLAILGTGVQARWHARAMCLVRSVREIRVAGRSVSRAAALADSLAGEGLGAAGSVAAGSVAAGRPEGVRAEGVRVRGVSGFAEALGGADIACATTHADQPVVWRGWLSAGVHVTSVGYNPAGRELDDATVRDALVCVESRSAALAPFPAGTNDLLEPIRDGVISAAHVHAELGELVSGVRGGRGSAEQITLYKSVGVAVQDAVAAALVLAAARQRGIGTHIAL
jgi:ornithine cyclodeaminase